MTDENKVDEVPTKSAGEILLESLSEMISEMDKVIASGDQSATKDATHKKTLAESLHFIISNG